MGETVNVGEAVLKLSIDVKEVQANLAKAKADANSALGGMKSDFNAIKLAWLGVSAAVGAYVIHAVSDYGKLDRAISTVVNTSKKMGIATDGLRDKVENYLDKMEITTRFQDTELATSLNGIIAKTKDLGQAMYLNSLAADLSVRKDITLQQSAEMLANLYVGNSRGLMMVAKELGVTGKNAEDASFLFKKLQTEMKGAAQEEDNQETSIKKMKTAWDNLGETLGKTVSPAIKEVADALAYALDKAAIKPIAVVDKYKYEIAELNKQIHDLYETTAEGSDADKMRAMKQIAFLETEVQRYQQLTHATEDAAKAADKLAEKKVEQKIKDDADFKKAQEAAGKKAKFLDAEIDQRNAIVDRLEKEWEWARALGAEFAGPVSKDMEAFFTLVKEGNASLSDSFAILGKSMAKSMLEMIAKVIDGYAADAFGQAILSTISEDYVGAAEEAAGGAALAAAAGGVRAVAAGLAKGGMVTGGTVSADTVPARIRKNEAVVPLDDPRAVGAMVSALNKSGASGGGGGNKYQIGQVVVQGGSRSAAKSAAYMLAEEIDKVELRKGKRGRRSSGA